MFLDDKSVNQYKIQFKTLDENTLTSRFVCPGYGLSSIPSKHFFSAPGQFSFSGFRIPEFLRFINQALSKWIDAGQLIKSGNILTRFHPKPPEMDNWLVNIIRQQRQGKWQPLLELIDANNTPLRHCSIDCLRVGV